LEDCVDKHVLVEARFTHQANIKPLYYEENKARFKKFEDKIIHLTIDKFPSAIKVGMPYLQFSRNIMAHWLNNRKTVGEDVILFGDIDEIPRGSVVSEYAPKITDSDKFGFKQTLYYYWTDAVVPIRWVGTAMITMNTLNNSFNGDFSSVRDNRRRVRGNPGTLNNGGWHFSYLGGVQAILDKIRSFSDVEWNTPEIANKINILSYLQKDMCHTTNKPLKLVTVDNTYPSYLLAHPEIYDKYLRRNFTK
jgi:beta-1,4-mannosyl-glycoprotein beta-1,4-N-acetylglucosaminyltransferase